MGQQEVNDWLKGQYKEDKDKWFKSTQIAKGVNQSIGSTTHNLRRLREGTMVRFKKGERHANSYEYQYFPDAEYNKAFL